MLHTKPRFRAIDAVLLVLCLAAGVLVYYRIQYGLGYRGNWAAIPQFLLRYDPTTGRWIANYLLQGLITTLKLSLWAMLPAMLVGLIVALCRTSTTLFLRMVGRSYVEADAQFVAGDGAVGETAASERLTHRQKMLLIVSGSRCARCGWLSTRRKISARSFWRLLGRRSVSA